MLAKTMLVIAALTVAACATPPKQHSIENARTYSKSKDVVWSNLMKFFSENSIQIKTLEKDSGVVYAEVMGATSGLSIDCGGQGIWLVRDTLLTLNVFVRETSDGGAMATVNAVGVQHRELDLSFYTPPTYETFPCVSTGHIERRILDAL